MVMVSPKFVSLKFCQILAHGCNDNQDVVLSLIVCINSLVSAGKIYAKKKMNHAVAIHGNRPFSVKKKQGRWKYF